MSEHPFDILAWCGGGPITRRSSTPTSTRSTPPSSSSSTRRSGVVRSRSAAAACSRRRTRRRARRALGHASLARATPLPRPPLRQQPCPRGSRARRRDRRRTARLHAARRAHLDRRGVPRRDRLRPPVRTTRGDGAADPLACARRARAADLGGGRDDEAPGEGRIASGEARRSRRGRARARTGVPRSPARRAAVGCRSRDARAARRARHPHRIDPRHVTTTRRAKSVGAQSAFR